MHSAKSHRNVSVRRVRRGEDYRDGALHANEEFHGRYVIAVRSEMYGVYAYEVEGVTELVSAVRHLAPWKEVVSLTIVPLGKGQ